MSQHKFQSKIYRFRPYESSNLYSSSITHISVNYQSNLQTNTYYNNNLSHLSQTIQCPPDLNVISLPPWRPSTRLRALYTHFQNTILCQHICLPCAFCGKLLYPTKAKWIPYNENYTYPLEINSQNINIYIRGEGSTCTICVCESCKNNRKRYPCPQLHPIPDVIEAIPITQRRFLSPVFLHCSLGRNLGANKYTESSALI